MELTATPHHRFRSSAKVISVFALVGALNGLIGAGVSYYLNSDRTSNLATLRFWSRAVVWIWPTSIMMTMAESGNRVLDSLVLGISVLANACIYGVLSILLVGVWKTLFQKHEE